MSKSGVVCPACGQEDRVFKVSHVYLDALALLNKNPQENIVPEVIGKEVQDPGLNLLKINAMRTFMNNFAPPSGSKQFARTIHPDLIVAAFTLVAIFLLVNIYTTQRPYFVPAAALLLIFYIAYFFMHKRILARFAQRKDEDIKEKQNLEDAIGRWMKLYYCARDEGVFNPKDQRLIPLEQMESYLLGKMEAPSTP